MLKTIQKFTLPVLLLAASSGCDEQLVQPNHAFAIIPNGGSSGPGGLAENPGEQYAFPEIIEQVFYPGYDLFAEYKCKTWRITWPWIDSDYNDELIPTVLSVNSGNLNSIAYLNNNSPALTHNSTMSLYYGQRVQSANDMWWELDHSFDENGSLDMESAFRKGKLFS